MSATIRGQFVGYERIQMYRDAPRMILGIEVDTVHTTFDWIRNELPKSQQQRFTNAPPVPLLDVSTVSAGASPTQHINNLARLAIDNPDQMHDIMIQIKELTE